MERTSKINFPAYGYNIHIIITDSITNSRVRRNKTFGNYKDKDYHTIGLHSYSEEKLLSALFFTEESTVETVAHECSHAVDHLFLSIGAESIDTEIRAYYLGHIVGKVWNLLQKKK